MTNKQKTIAACWRIVELYRNPAKGRVYFSQETCPLCSIEYTSSINCNYCVLSDGSYICASFRTYKEAHKFRFQIYLLSLNITDELRKAFNDRADCYEFYIIPRLKRLPASRFTKKGFKPIKWDYSR